MLRRVGDDGCDERISDEASVSVLVRRHALAARCDHKGRVRHDLVERLPLDRLVEAAQSKLDGGHPVERGVEAGQLEGALGDVGGDHVLRVPRGVQRLDAAPGAEVERAVDLRADHQPREGHRRPSDTEHVVRGDGRAQSHFAEVGSDPPAARAEGIDEGVRPEVEHRAHGLAVETHQAEFDRAVDTQRGKRYCEAMRGHGEAEHKQGRECAEAIRRLHRAPRRFALSATKRGSGIRPPQRFDGVGGVAGGEQIVAQAGDEGRSHCVIQPHRRPTP